MATEGNVEGSNRYLSRHHVSDFHVHYSFDILSSSILENFSLGTPWAKKDYEFFCAEQQVCVCTRLSVRGTYFQLTSHCARLQRVTLMR